MQFKRCTPIQTRVSGDHQLIAANSKTAEAEVPANSQSPPVRQRLSGALFSDEQMSKLGRCVTFAGSRLVGQIAERRLSVVRTAAIVRCSRSVIYPGTAGIWSDAAILSRGLRRTYA